MTTDPQGAGGGIPLKVDGNYKIPSHEIFQLTLAFLFPITTG
jgi:hypothetical protein